MSVIPMEKIVEEHVRNDKHATDPSHKARHFRMGVMKLQLWHCGAVAHCPGGFSSFPALFWNVTSLPLVSHQALLLLLTCHLCIWPNYPIVSTCSLLPWVFRSSVSPLSLPECLRLHVLALKQPQPLNSVRQLFLKVERFFVFWSFVIT